MDHVEVVGACRQLGHHLQVQVRRHVGHLVGVEALAQRLLEGLQPSRGRGGLRREEGDVVPLVRPARRTVSRRRAPSRRRHRGALPRRAAPPARCVGGVRHRSRSPSRSRAPTVRCAVRDPPRSSRASPSCLVLHVVLHVALHVDGARATACFPSPATPRPPRGPAPEVRTGDAAGGSHARRRRWLFGAARSAVVGDEAALLQDPADQPPTGDPDVLVTLNGVATRIRDAASTAAASVTTRCSSSVTRASRSRARSSAASPPAGCPS